MSVNAPADGDDAIVGIAVGVTLIAAAVYLVVLFVASVVGLIDQIASPAARIEFNSSVVLMTALPLFLFSYLTTPELRDNRPRLKASVAAALVGVVACAGATAAIAPGIDRPSSFEFAAAAYLLFAACGLLPALVVGRSYVFFDRDTQVATEGDHYIDTGQLDTETKRIVAKHSNATLKAPPGWRPPALFGAKDALTHADLRRMLALEEEEAQRLRDLLETRAANAHKAREDAHHAFVSSLSQEEQALFEATLRADVEAIKGITAYKQEIAAETIRLTNRNDELRATAAELEAKLRATRAEVAAQRREITALTAELDTLRGAAASLAVSERTRVAQQHEIDWLWGERDQLIAHLSARGSNAGATRQEPTVVRMPPHRAAGSSAGTTTYGGR